MCLSLYKSKDGECVALFGGGAGLRLHACACAHLVKVDRWLHAHVMLDSFSDSCQQPFVDQFDDEERWEELIPDDPAPGSVEQCADVITFLASPRASHVSGTTLTIDGGASAR